MNDESNNLGKDNSLLEESERDVVGLFLMGIMDLIGSGFEKRCALRLQGQGTHLVGLPLPFFSLSLPLSLSPSLSHTHTHTHRHTHTQTHTHTHTHRGSS